MNFLKRFEDINMLTKRFIEEATQVQLDDFLMYAGMTLIDMAGAFEHWKYYGSKVFRLSKDLIEAFHNTDIPLNITADEFHYPFACFIIDGNEIPLFTTKLKGKDFPVYQIMFCDSKQIFADRKNYAFTENFKLTDEIGHSKRVYGFIPVADIAFERIKFNLEAGMTYEELSTRGRTTPNEIPCDLNDVKGIVNILYNTILYINDPTREISSTEHKESCKVKIKDGEKIRQEYIYLKPPNNYISLGKSGTGHSLDHRVHVRGHWRNQAHGEGRQLRKRIWILPFWKGPEMSEMVNKTYIVK